jgi:2-hydroxychromene-2-carboxylate isomerase
MTSARTLRIYLDYISPNAYLAWHQLPALADKYGYQIEAVPVLYAALLDASGTLGPGETPAKGRWMMKNVQRKAILLGLPMQTPAYFPFNPILALRMSLLPLERPMRHKLIDALFEAVWCRSLHVSEPEVAERVANELGLPGAELVAQASQTEIKSRLRQQTEDAIKRGVFGVPTMEIGDELFWGYDDFPYLELYLAGRDPLDQAGARRLVDGTTRPSSLRRRVRPAQS